MQLYAHAVNIMEEHILHIKQIAHIIVLDKNKTL